MISQVHYTAPLFTLVSHEGRPVSLQSYQGRQCVVLVFLRSLL